MVKQIEQKVKPKEQKRHLIKAYLDDDEFEKFQMFAKACKCTNSNFVRQLLAGAHLVAFPPEDYMRLKNEFLNIGVNINQIARVANRDGYLNVKEYEKQADMMFRMCAEMSSILLRCGAKINDDLIEPSPFLTEFLIKNLRKEQSKFCSVIHRGFLGSSRRLPLRI